MNMRDLQVAVCLLCCLLTNSLPAATPEVRGTWLTTTGVDHIRTGFNTEGTMHDLRAVGLNTVYVETWKNGYTNFPSQTLKALIGTTDRNPTIGTTRDLVQETLIHAHRNQMEYYGWFEYGAMSQYIGAGGNPNNPLSNYMKNRGWLLKNQSGQYADSTNGGFAYMNIAVPEVRQFIIGMTLEAVNRYDLDGIQFDDHMAWPVNFGFDSTTINLYTSQTGNPAPTSPTNSQFSAWRQQKVTKFASEFYSAVKSARPEIKFSISPSITSFSTTNYNADWPLWESQGIFDEFAIQMYRSSLSSFNSIVNQQVTPFEPNDLDKLVFGLRINPSPLTPYNDVQSMIQRSRTEGAAGHSLWFSSGVLDIYESQLTSFYDVAGQGQAQNPNFSADHRPAPLVASSLGSGLWDVKVTNADRYRIVAKIGSFWTEFNVAELNAGSQLIQVPGATQVELLVDRRTATSFLGDFDGDFDVDASDFILWQRGKGLTSGATAMDGDANADGKVDALDLARWQLNYGWFQANGAVSQHSIPEPSANAILSVIILGWLIQIRHFKSEFFRKRIPI
ncbi:glycoside hydrolase family 10 protein [Bythopirellula polymerisocia]|uniref:Glycosyl hydrolase-like 10 domain-containing protein n=1 Tax=Bythopirellula polymerisocia TaxID=2528003 RepID=A0A5C6CFG9_9BACT|nr:family 10 glycosylhydrolase [Bythopirellula polymerisocia]TWU23653.1 hypothetical protein Pla144_38280 [Bythopirellula polymerisocia]